MDKNDLKILSGNIVMESTLPRNTKIQLIRFIKEATETQLKAFLLDGEIITKSKMDQYTVEIINDRFMVSEAGGRIAKLRKTHSSLVGAASGTNPAWLLYRKIRSKMDLCTKRCGTYELNTSRRQHCMIKCKVQTLRSQIDTYKKDKTNAVLVPKLERELAKAERTLVKSERSFAKRGAEVYSK